jgi:hypothetical protein
MAGLRFADGTGPGDAPIARFRESAPVFLTFDSLWFQPLPRYHYEVTLEFVPQGRMLRPPRRFEIYRIGFVLNVVYESISIEYAGVAPKRHVWRRPILDTAADPPGRPFVHDPVQLVQVIPIVVEGQERLVVDRVNVAPGVELFYGPSGFGDLLDPFSPEGYHPRPNQRIHLSYIDQPRIALPQRFEGGRLQRAEQIVVFRFWIVALRGAGVAATDILGHSPEFTLQGWFEPGPSSLRSLEPHPRWIAVGLAGRHVRPFRDQRDVERASRGAESVQPRPGPGGTPPVLTGTTANERLVQWFRDERLLPPVGASVQTHL